MITAQKFNGILKSIRSTGAKLDALIAEGIEYAVQQAQKAGNFDAFSKLADACPVYARRIVRDAEKASRKAHKNRDWRDGAPELARETAEKELAERREKASKPRKPRAAAQPDPETQRPADGPAVKALGGVLKAAGGEPLTLTEEEYQAALAAVQALRQGDLAQAS